MSSSAIDSGSVLGGGARRARRDRRGRVVSRNGLRRRAGAVRSCARPLGCVRDPTVRVPLLLAALAVVGVGAAGASRVRSAVVGENVPATGTE